MTSRNSTSAGAWSAALIPPWAGLAVMMIGVIVLVGWWAGIEELKRLIPGWVSMKANTALAFVLTGAALWLLTGKGPGWVKHGIACGAAGAAVIIGGLTLVEYLTGVRLGIDEYLFKEAPEPHLMFPGRMVPATALNFVMLGTALLFLNRGRMQLVLILALAAGLAAFLALAGYLYGAEFRYGLGSTAAMAIHTSLAFLLLSAGVATASLDDGMMAMIRNNSAAGVLVRRLLPAAFLVPIILGWLRLAGQHYGFYGTEFGTALLVVALIFVFVVFIWWSARTVIRLEHERERAEEAIRERDRRFSAATQSTNDAFISANASGDILSWNNGARRIFGYEEDEVVGKPLTILMPERYHEAYRKGLERFKETGDAHVIGSPVELNGLRKDGCEFPLELSLATWSANGEAFFSGVIRDVTERKRADAALENERYLLNSLMDNVPDRIYFKDREGRFLRNNRAHLARFGLTDPAQAMGRSDFDFFPRGHAERAREDERRVMESGQMLDHEERIDWPGGRVEWALVTKLPLRDAGGEIVGTFGISHDITHRKRGEEELKSMSDRLLLATSAAAIGIWDFDFESDCLIWDRQMFRIFGVEPERFSGRYADWEATVHPDDLPRENEKIKRVIQGEGGFDSEFRVVWPDKSIRHVKADAIVVRDSSGKPVRMIGTNRDITEQRRGEDDLKRTLTELERSNTELEQFAYVASHDLQEPLRAVTGCVQLLQKSYGDKLEAEAGELILHAVEGAARMRKLIDDLLAFSRVGMRGKPFEPTDCNAALDVALANLATSLHETGARVTHDPLPTLNADPAQMQQLFQNLIGNAVKFHGERPPEIHVGARLETGRWLFSVRDNGIGIEPQYRARIFVIFQRLHTRAEYSGTGVGLAICKRIVERHGGDIWVESEPGQGATFYFTIPEKGNHAS